MSKAACPLRFVAREGVDEEIRQNLGNGYAGNMTDTQRKWLAVGFGLVALLIVGSELLLGQPLNSSRPASRLMACLLYQSHHPISITAYERIRF